MPYNVKQRQKYKYFSQIILNIERKVKINYK